MQSAVILNECNQGISIQFLKMCNDRFAVLSYEDEKGHKTLAIDISNQNRLYIVEFNQNLWEYDTKRRNGSQFNFIFKKGTKHREYQFNKDFLIHLNAFILPSWGRLPYILDFKRA